MQKGQDMNRQFCSEWNIWFWPFLRRTVLFVINIQHSTKYQQSYSLPLPFGHVLSLSRPILHTEPKSNFPIRSIQKKATVNLSLFNKYFEITSRYLFGNCTLFSGKVLICRKWERIFTRARVWLLHWNWFTETFYSCVEFNPRVFTHHQVKTLPEVKGKVLPKSF